MLFVRRRRPNCSNSLSHNDGKTHSVQPAFPHDRDPNGHGSPINFSDSMVDSCSNLVH